MGITVALRKSFHMKKIFSLILVFMFIFLAFPGTVTKAMAEGECTVTIDPSGGKGSPVQVEVPYGGTYELQECFFEAPDGMAFDFYYIGTAAEKFHPGDVLDIYEDTVIKIEWTEAVYAAEFVPITFEPVHEGYVASTRRERLYIYNRGNVALNTNGASVYQDSTEYFGIHWSAVDPLVRPEEYMDYLSVWLQPDLPKGTYSSTIYFQDADGKIDPISMVVTITVLGEDEVYVTFDNNGIGDPVPGIAVPKDIDFKTAKRREDWPWPTCQGYAFDDWYYDQDCESFTYADECIDRDMTLYAHWNERVENIRLSLEATPKAGDYSQDYLNVEIDDDMISVKEVSWLIYDEGTFRGFYGNFEEGDRYYLFVRLRIQDTTRIFDCNPNIGYHYFGELTLNGKDVSRDLDSFDVTSDKKQIDLIITVDFSIKLESPTVTAKNVYGEGIKLSWDPVSGATRYFVLRKEPDFDWPMGLGHTTDTTFTDTEAKMGVSYIYYVRAQCDTGSSENSEGKTIVYNPFKDVKTSASYFKHLAWAYNNDVIKGTSATTFNPNGDCKRCDLAVMLYRMYGKPSVSGQSIPFTDVKSSDYYYKAVVWAYNQGYIKGTSSTKFNPKGSITRQDMVVILWRMNGSPKVNIDNPFTDVSEDSYAYKAIMWAYKNKITSGTSSDKFSPKSNCLRYQLAVFLNKFNNIVHVI